MDGSSSRNRGMAFRFSWNFPGCAPRWFYALFEKSQNAQSANLFPPLCVIVNAVEKKHTLLFNRRANGPPVEKKCMFLFNCVDYNAEWRKKIR